MSQIYKSGSGGGPVPPTVATRYNTDVNSPAIPALNILNVPGGSVTTNNVHGIQTDGSSGSNTLTVELTNRATGSVTTTGAATASLITLPLGATPGTYTFDITVAAFATAGIGTPLGGGYTIVGAIRTTGAAAILIPTQVVDHFEEAALGSPTQITASLGVSGNNAVVSVTGKSDGAAGFVIDWVGTLLYTFAS